MFTSKERSKTGVNLFHRCPDPNTRPSPPMVRSNDSFLTASRCPHAVCSSLTAPSEGTAPVGFLPPQRPGRGRRSYWAGNTLLRLTAPPGRRLLHSPDECSKGDRIAHFPSIILCFSSIFSHLPNSGCKNFVFRGYLKASCSSVRTSVQALMPWERGAGGK